VNAPDLITGALYGSMAAFALWGGLSTSCVRLVQLWRSVPEDTERLERDSEDTDVWSWVSVRSSGGEVATEELMPAPPAPPDSASFSARFLHISAAQRGTGLIEARPNSGSR
jgi:hypothetical protein